MAVKSKICKLKRNNQKRNKLVKQGVIKKTNNAKKHIKEVPAKILKEPPAINNESEESDEGEDLLQMVDKDDIDFLKNAITNRSYGILNKVKYSGHSSKAKRHKTDEDGILENKYEEHIEDNSGKKIKTLLPIKTRTGLVSQEIEEEIDEVHEEFENVEDEEDADVEDEEMQEFTLEDNTIDTSKPISATQLLATRNEVLRQRKIHIGTLSSGLLENPEEKVTNFRTLLKIMDEETPEVYFTVKKLVIISLLEVFKDVLPSYEIKNLQTEGVKLKKDTLKLQKYEENLLQYYKKFLQKLEKYSFLLVKKKGNSGKISGEEVKLAELSIQALCDLLVTHPYFNYASNIAQVIVPFMNNSNKNVREIVKTAIKTVFKEDRKEEITLKILRLVNHYLKNHAHNVNIDMLEILLGLNLKDVDLDQEKTQDIKQKKMMAQKQKLLQMSKRERKKKKKLQELEQEMLETKAEENKQSKQKNLIEITKIVFNIYFRILKTSNNAKVLGTCLEGLAKFSHCINLEYYVDIVNVLDNLLKENWLGYREQLHCIQTIFTMLSGQGEALNVDPTRFYNTLYKDLLTTNTLKNHENFEIVLNILIDALVKRRKKNTNKRTIGFIKRIATLSLQLLHNGSLGCLGVIKTIMQLNRSVDILLDLDSSVGDGKFEAELDDPEYANASSTALYEMVAMSKHYHPVVNKLAKNIASAVPASGEGSLAPEYGKMTVEQLYSEFSMSEMAFNPAVPVPKKVQPKTRPTRLQWVDTKFHEECKNSLRVCNKRKRFWVEC